MRPQRLEIEGVHSFAGRQVIDFAALSAQGLFGIFGDTGSGKSTILDCLILALYGKIPEESAAQFIHLKRSQASVALEFLLADRRYRVERGFKLNPSRVRSTATARLIDLEANTLLCEQAERVTERVEELLGLGREDFLKVVALPQGEFSRFLKATSSDQTAIAGRLFSLESYGDRLTARAFARLKNRRRDLEQTESDLKAYEEITPEVLTERERALAELRRAALELAGEEREASERAQRVRNGFQLTKKLAAAREGLAAAEAELKGCDAEYLAEKRKAACEDIYPLYERCLELRGSAERASAKRGLAQKALLEAKSAESLAREKLASVRTEREAFSKSEGREDAIRALAGRAQEYADFAGQLAETRNAYREEAGRCREKGEALGRLRRELEKLGSERAALEEERVRLSESLSEIVSEEFLSRLKGTFSGDLDRAEAKFPGVGGEFVRTKDVIGSARADAGLLQSYTDLSERMRKADGAVSETAGKIATLEGEISRSEEEQGKISEQGSRARERVDALDKLLAEVGLKAFSELTPELDRIRKRRQALEEGLAAAQDALKEAESLTGQAVTAAGIATAEEESALREAVRAEGELADKLKDFGSLQELVEIHARSFSPDIVERVQAAQTRRDNFAAEIRAYEGDLKEEVGEAAVREAELLLEFLKGRLAQSQTRIGREEQALGQLKQALARKSVLEGERDRRRKLADLSDAVHRAVRGKELMKFAVEEYLREISDSASAILGGITGGNYRLVYENAGSGECGFFVADNRNGGERRAVVTLSGGETFLVSLALAVSLSEAVAVEGNNRVEFFFLDEGFGSLDAKLCDVVLDALYKLRETRFVIGLISHVEALKERIDSRLYVEYDEEEGSRVKL